MSVPSIITSVVKHIRERKIPCQIDAMSTRPTIASLEDQMDHEQRKVNTIYKLER